MKKIIFGAMLFLGACNDNSDAGKNDNTGNANEIQGGEQLFKINCSQCHKIGQDFIGPDLTGVETRWKDKNLLYAFVHNSQEVIANDPYAKELFAKWRKAYMQPFPQLSTKDIDAILTYANAAK